MTASDRPHAAAEEPTAASIFWRYLLPGRLDLTLSGIWVAVALVLFIFAVRSHLGWEAAVFPGVALLSGLLFGGSILLRAGLAALTAQLGRRTNATVIAISGAKRGTATARSRKRVKFLFFLPETQQKIRGFGPPLTAQEIAGGVWGVGDKLVIAYAAARPQWSVILSPRPTAKKAVEGGPAAGGGSLRKVKIAILGDRATGKTSLGGRFQTPFSAEMAASVGARVSRAQISTPHGERTIMLWDIDGGISEAMRHALCAGSAGFVVVADGTRAATERYALKLLADLRAEFPTHALGFFLNRGELVPGTPLPTAVSVCSGDAVTGEGVEAVLRSLSDAVRKQRGG